ncbi:phosphinothricin acetyltransferase [Pseudobutyrivibrio sp. OR37]|uniref:GNAT family N-acetyltransferase n=1 Tax=Pseudobutyrivibrio sp. OR37 TaxID=1798186 RepID=UPI0008F319D1|nr:GNAT family N-acetyltransferase [Pseudobutyrivibrio sp. OR37]SFI00493.1 phosphinothricin acetyltransferase [Pseudobutyrivibrio sp. OR37]
MIYKIREAVTSDAKAIHDIYGYYVANTYVTFSEINPTVQGYADSIVNTKQDYPYIVAVDEEDKVVGMAYGGRLRHHDAYKYAVETTIYLAPEVPKKSGIGKLLYTELEARLKTMGYKFMYGVITDDNEASIAFHKALGFEEVGHFTDIGYKFGNWKGIVWYRKQIGSLSDMPE